MKTSDFNDWKPVSTHPKKSKSVTLLANFGRGKKDYFLPGAWIKEVGFCKMSGELFPKGIKLVAWRVGQFDKMRDAAFGQPPDSNFIWPPVEKRRERA